MKSLIPQFLGELGEPERKDPYQNWIRIDFCKPGYIARLLVISQELYHEAG